MQQTILAIDADASDLMNSEIGCSMEVLKKCPKKISSTALILQVKEKSMMSYVIHGK